jgi:general secretion pathway protein G
MKRGFTLIELLIVVAIIAILAAIAVPNFLEAQTRAKIARVKADMRTLATGLETYVVDANRYPTGNGNLAKLLLELTTPIAYLTTVNYSDPFAPKPYFVGTPPVQNGNSIESLMYINFEHNAARLAAGDRTSWGDIVLGPDSGFRGYVLASYGPDRLESAGLAWHYSEVLAWSTDEMVLNEVYDATNGTVSQGEIPRPGGVLKPRSRFMTTD